ncbi:YL1 nuclear protein-domain-containing protein [Crepidotus variabilis]|uniref:YL1 nuclear protein-domain-containing protein n=1 Tax=Crepidotus variabilis TaxID=179855 RepID=A0A9P6E6Q1_9AGAR|nr:YL1 nuclear protein-domain-containing protein [Crepidotus variabilis]
MEEISNEGDIEMLATRRSRRSTAGNRMAEVMAEVALENEQKDLDDDVDFDNANDEQDVFGSDFESTDEEAEKQAEEVGETEAIQEEKRERKTARSRLEKATAAAHEKNKGTFNADIQISATPTKLRPRAKARVQLGTVVDAATGEMVVSKSREKASKTRTSKRKHTVLNTSATVTRLKESEQKKASQPKKAKAETKTYTQAELIALALDTEEGNIREHRDYLKNEEEKRKRARVVRTAVEGHKLRWVSRIEEAKVPIPPPGPTLPSTTLPVSITSSAYRSVYGPPGTLFTPTNYTFSAGTLVKNNLTSTSTPQPSTSSQYQYTPYQHSAFPVWPPPPQQQPYFAPSTRSAPATNIPTSNTTPGQEPSSSTLATTSANPSSLNLTSATTSAPMAETTTPIELPQPEFRMEKVTKDYVVHELTQQKGGPKPSWNENMKAMFGDHVKWDEVKVFVGKNRPLSRPRQTCPITGRQAHYLDPRTGVPYANSRAFKVLTQLLEHEYVWNPSSGSYMDHGTPPPNPEAGESDRRRDVTGSSDVIMETT